MLGPGGGSMGPTQLRPRTVPRADAEATRPVAADPAANLPEENLDLNFTQNAFRSTAPQMGGYDASGMEEDESTGLGGMPGGFVVPSEPAMSEAAGKGMPGMMPGMAGMGAGGGMGGMPGQDGMDGYYGAYGDDNRMGYPGGGDR